MVDPKHPQDAATAAAGAISIMESDDEQVARRWNAIEQLTQVFGFSQSLAEEAVDAVGADATAAYNYLLDHGQQDRGGPIVPIFDCPHVAHHVKISLNQLPLNPSACVCTYFRDVAAATSTTDPHAKQHNINNSSQHNQQEQQPSSKKSALTSEGSCSSEGENWLCLECGVIRCSRYVNAHGVAHWQETKQATSPEVEVMDSTDCGRSNENVGHCVALSLADLSVWCHACSSYIQHRELQPLLRQMEALKFNNSEDDNNETNNNKINVNNASHHVVATGRGGSYDDEASLPLRKKARSSQDLLDENEAQEESVGDCDQLAMAHSFCSADLDDACEEAGRADENLTSNKKRSSGKSSAGDPATAATATAASEDEDDDDEALIEIVRAAAAARGIPFEWIIEKAVAEGEEDDEEVEYPFDHLPNSLEDVANFILSPKCRSILVLAGAGMSVASGIPDFRSADGLYATMNPDLLTASESERRAMRLDPTAALEQTLFLQNPLPCLELNREFILGTRAQRWKATLAHRFVELLHAKTGKLVRLYTQNIDGLEDQCTQLPREKVIAVHGSMDRAECATCNSEADMAVFADQVRRQIKDLSRKDPQAPEESTPIDCAVCGCNSMKPAIVLFRSSLPKIFFDSIPDDIKGVDLLFVIGTSLRVAPANSLVWRVPRSALRVLVNREPVGTHLGMDADSGRRDYFAQGDCDDVLLDLMEHLGWIEDLAPLLETHQLPDSSSRLLRERLGRASSISTASSEGSNRGEGDERASESSPL